MPDWDAPMWESLWAPYDEGTYQQVLSLIQPTDVVIDIGAGDLRLDRELAKACKHVYAYEQQAEIVARGLRAGPLPANLSVVVGDARTLPFPFQVTVGVLLMRHCRDVSFYMKKLRQIGAHRLLTNARWKLDVEEIDLRAPRVPYEQIRIGWYACECGVTGFVQGPPEALTPAVLNSVYEVTDCPACRTR